MRQRLILRVTVVLTLLAARAVLAAAEDYEIGGPLAGLRLPLFPTQHGEPPGYPGCLPDANNPANLLNDREGLSPERQLHPESVEHWRANDFKYLPVRSLYDRQSLLKNWTAADLAGDGPRETYAEPLYWVRRHRSPRRLDLTSAPVDVVRCRPGGPVFTLDCGDLAAGMYCLSVVGAVETRDIQRHRKPLYLRVRVNDGLDGEVSTCRMRIGYVDQFYSVAEIYFHTPEKRTCAATVEVDEGSLVELLVHNIELHDVLAGRVRRPIKQRMTLNDPAGAGAPAPPGNEEERQARWTRDAALWNRFLPLNAQPGIIYGMSSNDSKGNWPRLGAGGREPQAIKAEYGAWKAGKGDVLAVNEKLKLSYTLTDYRAGKTLPDPYPFKDDGCGLWYPPATPDQKPQNWLPAAQAVYRRLRDYTYQMNRSVQQYEQKGDAQAGRDAAVRLCRIAWDLPAWHSAQALSSIILQPGAYHKDWRHRHRIVMRRPLDPKPLIDTYDRLFNIIKGDADLARSLGRFVPRVGSPADVVQLLDVYLVQEMAKRYLRYQGVDANNPALMAEVAAVLGDREVTDPWMEWVFTRTWMYPLSTSGLADVIVSGCGRDGAKYIGSFYYAQVEEASRNGEMMETYINAGGNPRFDLRDPKKYPKVQAACDWFLRSRVAGLYFPRIGDVTGPVANYGYWFNLMEAPTRRGWRWTKAPRFAWMLKHCFGRKDMTDAEWAEIEAAAAKQTRAPWLENRSRVLANWFGVLESGVQHDDMRFRRAAHLRVGQGYGHQHNDTLDLQVHAHGLPMTVDGGQRPGYSRPADRSTRVHNLVEVDAGSWIGHSWVTALSDAEGARYLAAEAQPPAAHANVRCYRRQIALIDVDAGRGARPLSSKEVQPSYRKLDPDAVTANSYVFDVVRVAGGKVHTYCFHGACDDEFTVNVERLPVGQLPAVEQDYLKPFPKPERSFGADAPDSIVATWRYPRTSASVAGTEQHMARWPWREDSPPKYTRLHLPGQKGARVLGGYYWHHQSKPGFGFTNLYVQHRSDNETDKVFAAIIEPYAGTPFIEKVELLPAAEGGAERPVAVRVVIGGRTDVCMAGDSGKPASWRLGKQGDAKSDGEFAFLSHDARGLRQAAVTGGTVFHGPGITLRVAARERVGKVIGVDYAAKRIRIDQAWPAGDLLRERVFEIGLPGRRTTCTLTGVETEAAGSVLAVRGGADLYLARVTGVESDKGLVHCSLGLPFLGGDPCPGLDRQLVASNEAGTKFWRADYLGGSRADRKYTFRLSGARVSIEDFGRTKGFRLWEYGVGDTVRQSTFVSLRRVERGVYELTADTDVTVRIGGTERAVTLAELAKANGRVQIRVE